MEKIRCTCENCGCTFGLWPSQLEATRGRGRYCSVECRAQHRVGTNHPQWKGKVRTPRGYVKLHMADGSLVYEHRYVMEQHLGRPLLPGEDVHHINKDKADNRVENLRIVNKTEHSSLHADDRRVGINGRWSRHYAWCRECRSTSRRHHALGLCENCYRRIYWSQSD